MPQKPTVPPLPHEPSGLFPAGSIAEFSIRADPEEFRQASVWAENAGAKLGVPAAELERLDLCLNETLANIIDHGGNAALASPINLRLEARTGEAQCEAILTVSDGGAAYNPLASPLKPLPGSLAEAQPGGLGLRLIRNMSDVLHYAHREGRNQLTFGVRWMRQDG
jgi:serine/threonine-protein kinase RsbW